MGKNYNGTQISQSVTVSEVAGATVEDCRNKSDFDRLMASTSLVILDLKEIDPERHRRLTGKDNANILVKAAGLAEPVVGFTQAVNRKLIFFTAVFF